MEVHIPSTITNNITGPKIPGKNKEETIREINRLITYHSHRIEYMQIIIQKLLSTFEGVAFTCSDIKIKEEIKYIDIETPQDYPYHICFRLEIAFNEFGTDKCIFLPRENLKDKGNSRLFYPANISQEEFNYIDEFARILNQKIIEKWHTPGVWSYQLTLDEIKKYLDEYINQNKERIQKRQNRAKKPAEINHHLIKRKKDPTMYNIKTKLTESLEKKQESINQKIIQEQKLVYKLCTYNATMIGDILVNLFSTFEGEHFEIKFEEKDNALTEVDTASIHTINQYKRNFYLKYMLKIYSTTEGELNCTIIPPQFIKSKTKKQDTTPENFLLPKELPQNELDYFQLFLEKLYYYRRNKYFDEEETLTITPLEIKFVLEDFIDENKQKIEIRNQSQENYFKEHVAAQNEKMRRQRCKIERIPLINTIKSLINDNPTININYQVSSNITYDYTSDQEVLTTATNILTFYNHSKKQICYFSSRTGQVPNIKNDITQTQALALAQNKDEYISFYKFITQIQPASNIIPELKAFLEELERYYETKQTITSADINELLKTNKKYTYILEKKKNRTLTKDN